VRRYPYAETVARLSDALQLDESSRIELRAAARRVGVVASTGRRGELPDLGPPNQQFAKVEPPSAQLQDQELNLRKSVAAVGLSDLPLEPTSIFGRDEDVQLVKGLIRRSEVRILTLTGAGGVGKTRLAVHVAEALHNERAGRVIYVPLATLGDPSHVVPAIGRALGLDENNAQMSIEGLKYRLAGEEFLLVLDNFEHLQAARTAVIELVRACPQLSVLITSRSSLRIAGEHEISVLPLATPESADSLDIPALAGVPSVRLFCDRARYSDISFALGAANAAAVSEICRRLDGLPLALELAAARLKLFTPDTLFGRLEHRLPLLVEGPRDRPAHQRTLRGTIEWSHKLLETDEQLLFRKLAVLVSGWDVVAAEAIASSRDLPQSDIVSALAGLVDHSLIIRRTGPDGEVRFGMLETIREFAFEQLQMNAELAATQRLHAEYFANVAEDLETRSVGIEREKQLMRFRAEHDNFQAALRWCFETNELNFASRIVGALWNSWACGYVSEGRGWAETLLAQQATAVSSHCYAKVLTTAGIMAILQADAPAASVYLGDAVSIFRTMPNQRFGLALALTHLGQCLASTRADDARFLVDEALAIFEQLGNNHWRSMALRHRGMIAEAVGDPAVSAYYAQSLDLARATGDPRGLGQSLCYVGRLALREGDKHSAYAALSESLALFVRVGDRRYMAVALESLARLAQFDRRDHQARGLFAEALDLFREAGDQPGIAACQIGLGHIHMAVGDAEEPPGAGL
jgi:predicted ATPase